MLVIWLPIPNRTNRKRATMCSSAVLQAHAHKFYSKLYSCKHIYGHHTPNLESSIQTARAFGVYTRDFKFLVATASREYQRPIPMMSILCEAKSNSETCNWQLYEWSGGVVYAGRFASPPDYTT